MITLPDEKWEELFDAVNATVCKAIDDLPPEVQAKADQIACVVDKYTTRPEWKDAIILGCYWQMTNTIMIFVGQIYEQCNQDLEGTMASVRQVYYHELAHAIGDLAEYEVKELGL